MKKSILFIMFVVFASVLFSCNDEGLNSNPNQENNTEINSVVVVDETDKGIAEEVIEDETAEIKGNIYLYGEMHGVEAILDKELELWSDYYQNHGMRHLFIELSYFTAEYLNVWMQEEDDEILDSIYNNWKGTQSYSEVVSDFYKTIKEDFPETIFHGTDVGHQYGTTGARFRVYLMNNDLEDTEMYELTINAINQGKKYYKDNDHAYRENMMVENFIREFDKLENESVMGVYGGAHTDFEAMDYYGLVPSMANQLKDIYQDNIYSESLGYLSLVQEPLSVDIIEVEGKEYEASYFGRSDLTGFKDYAYREFWRLENAYDDFKDYSFWDVLPYNNYPMPIEVGQVFVVEYTKTDDSSSRIYYRSDGYSWNGLLSTFGMSIDNISKVEEPVSREVIAIDGKDYEADYYGDIKFKAFIGCESIEYWKVNNAYEDLKNTSKGDYMLLSANYPFEIEKENVYIINFKMTDGTTMKFHMICDGEMYNEKIYTTELVVE
ncbi:MAG: hypothetical protein JEZ08_12645 [Clostridiales bacterium]|nr:hypothetical protein [Clostridiales bacterium]